jgi:hypothetical protein
MKYAAPMKPVMFQTSSKFVWISFEVAKLRASINGSGPRYLARLRNPNTICRPKSNMAEKKYA